MTTLASNVVTAMDLAKLHTNGRVIPYIEMLEQTNEIMEYFPWVPCNNGTAYDTAIQVGLPEVFYTLYNQAVPVSKGEDVQVREQTAILEAWSEIELKTIQASIKGNVTIPEYRLRKARGFVSALGIKFASTLWYGNYGLDPKEFTGLSTRYSSLSAANGQNIIDAGGTGTDNTSVWVLVLSDTTIHGIYPESEDGAAGMQHNDFGIQTVQGTTGIAGTRMRAYQENWIWRHGLCVPNWKYGVRIANIDVSNLIAESSAADLIKLLVIALGKIPSMSVGRPVICMNRTVKTRMATQELTSVRGGGMRYDDVQGRKVLTFQDIPIATTDALLNTEARVV